MSLVCSFRVQSVSNLYQYRLMDIYFVLWVLKHYYFILLLKSFHLWHWEHYPDLLLGFCVLLCPFDIHTFLSVCVCVEYFVSFWPYMGSVSCYIFTVKFLELIISPEISGSFFLKMVLETKIWLLDVCIATGVSFLLGDLSRQKGNLTCFTEHV